MFNNLLDDNAARYAKKGTAFFYSPRFSYLIVRLYQSILTTSVASSFATLPPLKCCSMAFSGE